MNRPHTAEEVSALSPSPQLELWWRLMGESAHLDYLSVPGALQRRIEGMRGYVSYSISYRGDWLKGDPRVFNPEHNKYVAVVSTDFGRGFTHGQTRGVGWGSTEAMALLEAAVQWRIADLERQLQLRRKRRENVL